MAMDCAVNGGLQHFLGIYLNINELNGCSSVNGGSTPIMDDVPHSYAGRTILRITKKGQVGSASAQCSRYNVMDINNCNHMYELCGCVFSGYVHRFPYILNGYVSQ